MLQPVSRIAPSSPIEAGVAELRSILVQRIRNNVKPGWIAEQFKASRSAPFLKKLIPELGSESEWIVLLTAILPHVVPGFFESVILEEVPTGGDFPEIGGIKQPGNRSMFPTGETVQYILAGNDFGERRKVREILSEEHFFFKQSILWIEPVKEGEPFMSGRIILSSDWVNRIILEKETAPRFGLDFPAQRIMTTMEWNDVVLHPQTMLQVNEIKTWLEHRDELYRDENLGRKIKRGYRVLFYGPSGTGKTLTVQLLGKQFNLDVYRIDLSQVVSKYIGETEKNLEAVFRKAESKNWILFFDEADALFGKRTNVQSSHDKYANQEVSYLLQRVEDYNGLIILASNYKTNLDDAFIRRFHSLVHFPMPNAQERLSLWKKTLPSGYELDPNLDLASLSQKYELSGAGILNAVQFATLQCLASGRGQLNETHLREGIRREYMKEEKTI